MKAAVLEKTGEDLRLRDDLEVPAPAPGQVLVRLAFSGVCRSQLMEVRGMRGADPYLPHLLGHEGTGVVEKVGEAVQKVRPGDRVVLTWIKGTGADVHGSVYRAGGRSINAGAVTTLNERALVSENRCVLLPAEMPLDIGALLGCAVPTGAGIVMNEVRPERGATVAVFGLGGVGLSALLALGLHECGMVVAVDRDSEKLRLAEALGATHTLDASTFDPVVVIRGLTSGRGVDHAIEAAGTVASIEAAFASVRKQGGQCIFASHPPAHEKIALDPHDLISGRRIAGSWGGASDPDRDLPTLAKHFLAGRFPLQHLVGRMYSLDEINLALRDLESGSALRPLVDFGLHSRS